MPEHDTRIVDRKYRLLRLLDEGGMGAVYEAEHVLLRRKVAIKVLHPELCSQTEAVERFVREAQAASAIGHPNIVEIYDVGREDDGTAFIVMELLAGQDLGALLSTEGKLQPTRAIGIALQILSALHDAHAKGIIHRDMKPENVFLARDARLREEVKLLDFGVAKFKQRPGRQQLDLTQTGMTLGTPYYLSPEQARGRKAVDERIDLWSVGVMLYEMLAGRRPFEGEGYNEILSNVLIEEPPPLAQVAPEVPEPLRAVVERALQKDRDWRYQSAGEMIGDLLLFYDREASRELTSSVIQALFACRDRGESFAVTTGQRPSGPRGKNGRGADAWLLNSDIPEVVPRRRPRAWWIGLAGIAAAIALAAAAGFALIGQRSAGSSDAARSIPAAAPQQPRPAPPAPTPAPASVRIELEGLPAGARIELDGRPAPAPLTRVRSETPAILKVFVDGYRPFEQAIRFDRDQRIRPALEPLPADPVAPPARRDRSARKRKSRDRPLLAENPFDS